jgi:hypothetical protein
LLRLRLSIRRPLADGTSESSPPVRKPSPQPDKIASGRA